MANDRTYFMRRAAQDGVGIEHQYILGGKRVDEVVMRLREAHIDGRTDQIEIAGPQKVHRVVVGRVVENVNSKIAERLLCKACHAPHDLRRAIERDDVHGDSLHHPPNAPTRTPQYARPFVGCRTILPIMPRTIDPRTATPAAPPRCLCT